MAGSTMVAWRAQIVVRMVDLRRVVLAPMRESVGAAR
jgi:hypothetical protein